MLHFTECKRRLLKRQLNNVNNVNRLLSMKVMEGNGWLYKSIEIFDFKSNSYNSEVKEWIINTY